MISRRWLTGFAAFVLTLGICRVAHANSLSPYVYFWPGIIYITLVYAFPASLLAAFLERPFYTAAGLKRRALVFSLRANFLSTIVGILLIPIGGPAAVRNHCSPGVAAAATSVTLPHPAAS